MVTAALPVSASDPADPAPLPGGLLIPDLTQLASATLTRLLHRTAVTHRCARGR